MQWSFSTSSSALRASVRTASRPRTTRSDASARFCDAPEAGEGGAVLPHPSESRSFTDLSPEGLAATAKQIVGSSCSASILTTDNASAIDLDSTKGSDDLGTKTKHEPSPGESKTDKPIEKVVPENTEVTDTDLLLSTIKYASYKLTCQMAKKITATTSSFVSRNHGIIIAVLVVLLGMSMAGGFAASATSSNIAAPPPDHVAAISANSIRYLDAAADYEPPFNSTLFDPLPPSRTRLRRGPLDTISWLLCSWFSIIGTIALHHLSRLRRSPPSHSRCSILLNHLASQSEYLQALSDCTQPS